MGFCVFFKTKFCFFSKTPKTPGLKKGGLGLKKRFFSNLIFFQFFFVIFP